MVALREVIRGQEFQDELLAFEILQLSVDFGHSWAQKRALQAVVATPSLTVRQKEGSIALADAFAHHGEAGTRAVDIATFLEKVASSLLGTEVDDGA